MEICCDEFMSKLDKVINQESAYKRNPYATSDTAPKVRMKWEICSSPKEQECATVCNIQRRGLNGNHQRSEICRIFMIQDDSSIYKERVEIQTEEIQQKVWKCPVYLSISIS